MCYARQLHGGICHLATGHGTRFTHVGVVGVLWVFGRKSCASCLEMQWVGFASSMGLTSNSISSVLTRPEVKVPKPSDVPKAA
jgi:hypothetical protein